MADHQPSTDQTDRYSDRAREQLLAEMAELSTDMISRHAPGDWRFIYASPAVTHLLGYSVDEVIGLSAYELYHPDDVEDFRNRAPSVIYERGLYTHTYRFRRKDGHYTWLESTSRSLRCPDSGELLEILVVSRDASRRVAAEQANRRLARALEVSSDLVLFAHPDGEITWRNETALAELGSAPLYLSQLFGTTTPDQLQQALQIAQQQGRWRGETDFWSDRQQQSVPVMLELLAHQLHGQLDYYSLIARDLRAEHAARAAALQHQAEISHASRLISLGEMAAGLAHELNQPLTAISTFSGGLLRQLKQLPPAIQQQLQHPLQRINETALRSGQIIRRTMNFTRRHNAQPQALPLQPAVDELLQFCQHTATQHQVRLESDPIAADLKVQADPIQLQQVLLNLVMNAIEASSTLPEDCPRQVRVQASAASAHQVIISVCDRGPGLPDGPPEALFEPYVSHKPTGLGLGLSISRSLIEAQGGSLQAENRTNGGARFSFTLPCVNTTEDTS